MKKTHEEFVRDLNKVHGDGAYIPLEKYINSNTKILVKHNKCGYEWMVRPYSLLRGMGCPRCSGNARKTQEEFVQEIKDKYGDEYIILGNYKNWKNKLLVRHNSNNCKFHEYEVSPNNLLRGKRCPVCANQKAVLGINTIWDTDRWMVDLGISEDDAKRYSRCSNKKIKVICPDCKREKNVIISSIYKNKSIGCSCGDGKSYPEKFIMGLLKQLNIDFEIQYSPKWMGKKRYDFYIKNINCIIETHGSQHYEEKFVQIGGRTLKEEQANDKIKRETALTNGIKHYVELDCRESSLEWIKNSILNSELNDLYDLGDIDWQQCAKFSNKNIVKEVCDYWNDKKEDETIKDLAKEFKVGKTSIWNYLKKGTKLGWCNYKR
ncbi:TPA: hypothetical protein ACH354_002217 [Clostridium perfringens]